MNESTIKISADIGNSYSIMNHAELFEYAKQLAHRDEVLPADTELYQLLLTQLKNYQIFIENAFKNFSDDLQKDKTLLPSSTEWLLDNYFIVSEQIRAVKGDLTKHFYRELPKLKNGFLRSYPRVYSIAWELVAHTDSQIDFKTISEFINSYQTVSPLSSAELWSLPIMIRLVLIENLKKLMELAQTTIAKRKLAREWLDDEENLLSKIEKLFLTGKETDGVFLLWLMRGLRQADVRMMPGIKLVEQYLSQKDVNLEEIVKVENQRQATSRVTTGNIITSLRLVSSMDWLVFFENTSLAERVLRHESSGVYPQMDFNSRDRYRHIVEELSKSSRFSEQEIARRCVRMSLGGHVGYYLIGPGLPNLKKEIGYSPNLKKKLRDVINIQPTFFYLSISGLITLFLSLIGGKISALGNFGTLTSVLPASVTAVSIVNIIVNKIFTASAPPKLELKNGIPEEFKTMVVIPSLVNDKKGAEDLLNRLEKHYLANREENLFFGLLTDYCDALEKELPEDQEILDFLTEGTINLNKKYAKENSTLFFLFHRERKFNPKDKLWMGWERKRGKLMEFNRYISEGETGGFIRIVGNVDIWPEIKYVITVDADTQLPPNVARKLVGVMAHPLNSPKINSRKKIVEEGYTIIQPRVDVSAPSAAKSKFAQIFTGDAGLDPYHNTASDVYQDLFGTSAYTGKGIFDPRVMDKILRDKFPINTLLSHDLIEGAFTRVGLVSDLEILEDFPTSYEAFSVRQHRWIRGDWQVASWIFKLSGLSIIERYKIFDNLRRSLVTPLAFIAIVVGILNGNIYWTFVIFLFSYFPLLQKFFSQVFTHTPGEELKNYYWTVREEASILINRLIILSALIPFEAYRNSQAILTATVRSIFKLPGMLEWTTSSSTNLFSRQISKVYRNIILTSELPLLFIITGLNWIFWPILTMWFFAPVVVYRISRVKKETNKSIPVEKIIKLKLMALKMWRFFEETADTQSNYLPPDNMQMDPIKKIAFRTSPTNIGFLLMSTVTAYDMGFINKSEMEKRLNLVFETLQKLKRYEGHFFNWYDTKTLEPLQPNYISTADSSNLAASLISVKQAVLQISNDDSQKESIIKVLAAGWSEAWANLTFIPHEKIANVASKQISENEKVSVEIKKEINLFLKKIQNFDISNFQNISEECRKIEDKLSNIINQEKIEELRYWRNKIDQFLKKDNSIENPVLKNKLNNIASEAERMVREMNFTFLYKPERKSFAIGFNVDSLTHDDSYYDLLASEARLASFISIALGQISEKQWFDLGRPVTKIKGKTVLMSWGGTMFEYLLPDLWLRNPENTLLYQTSSAIVELQREFGKKNNIPWGASESGFFAFDFQYNYQYRQFGIDSISLKNELVENLVVAPYATFLALSIDPLASISNLEDLELWGMNSNYGFFEALDFTPTRLPPGYKAGVVRSYMAHHQGMSLSAINNCINDGIWQKRFYMDTLTLSVELLLAERIPKRALTVTPLEEKILPFRGKEPGEPLKAKYSAAGEFPKAYVLSNGEYTVAISNHGDGFSRYKNIDLTRWRQDSPYSNWGWTTLIKDISRDHLWSATLQPFFREPSNYHVFFSPNKAEFVRKDGQIETKYEVLVSPENNVEIRCVNLTNHSLENKKFEITHFAEIAMNKHREDLINPSFSKLFIETDYDKEKHCLLLRKRTDHEGDPELWVWVSSEGAEISEYETNRFNLFGRGNNIFQADFVNNKMGNFSGAALDPVASVRCTVRIPGGESRKIYFLTGTSDSKAAALNTASRYKDLKEIERTSNLALIHSQIELRHLNISSDEALIFQRMGSSLIYPEKEKKINLDLLRGTIPVRNELYAFGISGDLPIVLVLIKNREGLKLLRQSLAAHEFLRMKQVSFDLVVLNDQSSTYSGDLKEGILDVIETSLSRPLMDKKGGIFLRDFSVMLPREREILKTASSLVLNSVNGNIEDNLDMGYTDKPNRNAINKLLPKTKPMLDEISNPNKLMFSQKWGGFNQTGDEYVIKHPHKYPTPVPWSNVIANSGFGTLVTGQTMGYTWSENSQQNRLTERYADPVKETPGETLKIINLLSNATWSVTPWPIDTGRAAYQTRHGWGYTVFEGKSETLSWKCTVWVDLNEKVKIVSLEITNLTKNSLRLATEYEVKWVLGTNKEETQSYIVTNQDKKSEILNAENVWNERGVPKIAYLASNRRLAQMTENKISAEIKISKGQTETVNFMLGQADSIESAGEFVDKFRVQKYITESFNKVNNFWKNTNSLITVKTPDPAMDTLLNGWLTYQGLSGRLWGRTGFYQSSGAFGFRDQLQDVIALAYIHPNLTREHILAAARHQFPEGDVMHWWHPDTEEGLKTRISDDYLWLPYTVDRYSNLTGDKQIWDEMVPFLDMPVLNPEETERFGKASPVAMEKSIWDHCLKAIDHGINFGKNGLPLIGTGDWNDGLNSVGEKGEGESVWLGWFLYGLLNRFSVLLKEKGDLKKANKYSTTADKLMSALNTSGWDGDWYRRAYFDDGTLLGSRQNSEAFIDSIPQTWSIFSQDKPNEKSYSAIHSIERFLIRETEGIITLLNSPFENFPSFPGYIQGYLQGIRENGGQYTHAAVWVAAAYAKLKNGDRAYEVFRMLNPINHTDTDLKVEQYKGEPYVMAGDVYSHPQHLGRAGWTWYTGAAGWMFTVGISDILGLTVNGEWIEVNPCIPKGWEKYEMKYNFNGTIYKISVENPERTSYGVKTVLLNGKAIKNKKIKLVKENSEQNITVIMGNSVVI